MKPRMFHLVPLCLAVSACSSQRSQPVAKEDDLIRTYAITFGLEQAQAYDAMVTEVTGTNRPTGFQSTPPDACAFETVITLTRSDGIAQDTFHYETEFQFLPHAVHITYTLWPTTDSPGAPQSWIEVGEMKVVYARWQEASERCAHAVGGTIHRIPNE